MNIQNLSQREKNFLLYCIFRTNFPEYKAVYDTLDFKFKIGRADYRCSFNLIDNSLDVIRNFGFTPVAAGAVIVHLVQSLYLTISEMKHKKVISEIHDTLIEEFNNLTQEKAEFYAGRIKQTEGMDVPKEYQFKASEVRSGRKKKSESSALVIFSSIAVPIIIFWIAIGNLSMTANSEHSSEITDNKAYFCSKDPQTDKYGIQDYSGNWSACPAWSNASPLGFGFFVGGDSIIDCRGSVLFSTTESINQGSSLGDDAISYRGGFARYGFITRSGKLFAPEYDAISYLGDKRILLENDGKVTIVDSEGRAANDSWSRSYRLLAGHETMLSIILMIASLIPFILYFIEKRRLRN